MNPQFHIQIPRGSSASAKCHVVVSVTQQYETSPQEGGKEKAGFSLTEENVWALLDPLVPLPRHTQLNNRDIFFSLYDAQTVTPG